MTTQTNSPPEAQIPRGLKTKQYKNIIIQKCEIDNPSGSVCFSLEDLILGHCNTNGGAWVSDWWNPNSLSVIIREGKRTKDVGSFGFELTKAIDRIGWSGLNRDGSTIWIGWDLDVDHGKDSYLSQDEALRDAVRIWETLEGACEVRLSTSGIGLHVRHRLTEPLTHDEARAVIRGISESLGIKSDHAVEGRQCFWFWNKQHQPSAFRLILRPIGGSWGD